jgi:hypothetical protein
MREAIKREEQTMNTIITRTTKIGFGYTTSIMPGTTHTYSVDEPIYWGTIKTLRNRIANDRTYQSIKSGGTYCAIGMFVKVNGVIKKIDTDNTNWDYLWNMDALHEPRCAAFTDNKVMVYLQ